MPNGNSSPGAGWLLMRTSETDSGQHKCEATVHVDNADTTNDQEATSPTEAVSVSDDSMEVEAA